MQVCCSRPQTPQHAQPSPVQSVSASGAATFSPQSGASCATAGDEDVRSATTANAVRATSRLESLVALVAGSPPGLTGELAWR